VIKPTLNEILMLQPGAKADDMVAEAMGWTKATIKKPRPRRDDDSRPLALSSGQFWFDGNIIVQTWRPSTDWRDTGRVIDLIISNPLNTLYQVTGRELPNRYAVIRVLDYFGPGPQPIVEFMVFDIHPKLAVCKAFLRFVHGYYEVG